MVLGGNWYWLIHSTVMYLVLLYIWYFVILSSIHYIVPGLVIVRVSGEGIT